MRYKLMKYGALILGMALLSCKKEEVKFPEEEIKLIDPLSSSITETLYKQTAVNIDDVEPLKCLRSIYRGKDDSTLLITRHCVIDNQGWFYASRYLDEDKDGISELECTLAGTTVIGGIYTSRKWNCFKLKKNMPELLRRAEEWLGNPKDIYW
ncbi:MAG: hypothetical protein KKA62_01890 [Nanoarchaeota archaeon]|nr:hypothetical protein [Nanoarchaeota archaeon]MBU1643833.1 hypothetical protein [Nanoarchaeota archaeon]MBU1976685.1 hypothetical protein [Nanoarchaeota archaeon]